MIQPTNYEIAFGGRTLDALCNDGSKETVRLRILPLRLAEAYINRKLKRDDQGVIELCLGKSAEWGAEYKDTHYADKFTTAEQERLLAECDALNFTSAVRLSERAAKSAAGLSPLMEEMYRRQAEPMKRAITDALASVISSLTPPPSPASPLPTSSPTTAAPSSASSSSNTT